VTEPAAERVHLGPIDRAKRAALLVGISATGLNVWTGSPLAALWIGSRVQSNGPPSMGAVFLVIIAMGAFSYATLRLLRLLGTTYDRLVGRKPTVRAHVPWLRSLRGERPHEAGPEYTLSALDIVMCVMVIVALALFEYWFFFESTSSIDQRSGRG
jgi:hypothetical protein